MNEATGVVSDLFAQSVGFFPSWGVLREVREFALVFLTPAGNVDWHAASMAAAGTLADVVASAPDDPMGLPGSVYCLPPELYGSVAVSQYHSGWGRVRDSHEGAQRLVMLRCLVGKERLAEGKRNYACLQYRVWRRIHDSRAERIFDAAEAWQLLDDLHEEVVNRMKGG